RRLRSQEDSPRRRRPLRRRPETNLAQQLAHRRRRNRDPDTLEFTDDPLVAPARVLAGAAKDQLAQRALERRPPRQPVRIGPAAGDQLPVPAKQRTIRSCQPRPRPLSAEDRQRMAQDEDLQLLSATAPPQQPHQREQVPDNEITNDQSKLPSLDHGNRAPNLPSQRLREPRTSLRTLRADQRTPSKHYGAGRPQLSSVPQRGPFRETTDPSRLHRLEPASALRGWFLVRLHDPVLTRECDSALVDLEERERVVRADCGVRDTHLRHYGAPLRNDPEHFDRPAFRITAVEIHEIRAASDPD